MSDSFDHAPELFWKYLLDSSGDWELFINKVGEIKFTSPNCIEFTGYSAEEILNNNALILNCIDESFRSELKEFYNERIGNSKDILYIEFKIHSKEGKERWIGSNSKPAISSTGTFLGYRISNRDITEAKKSHQHFEKLLEQQNTLVLVTQIAASNDPFHARMQSILEIIGKYTRVSRVYIFEDNEEGTFTSNTFEWCNEGVLSQKDNLQDFDYAMIPSWDKILSEKGIIMVPDIKLLPDDIYQILNPQGIKAILILPLHFNDRRIGFVGLDECKITRDWDTDEINLLKMVSNTITNSLYRRKYEDELEKIGKQLQHLLDNKTLELERSENYYKALIEVQPDLVCRWLPDTTLTYVNEAYCNFFGIPGSEMTGKKWLDFLDPDSRNYTELHIKSLLESRKTVIYDHISKNFKDEPRWHQWIDTPLINSQGIITEVQSSGRDITDKIKYEDQLKSAKEKAEELDRIKSEFLHLISHELRTPLNGILGFSELIANTVSIDQIITFNNYIRQSGIKLFRMIEDILTLTNIQGGKTRLKMEEFELLPEMRELQNNFGLESLKINRNIKLQLKYLLKPDFKLFSDREKLIFILTRLLDNAFTFSEKGIITFGVELKGSFIEFFVKDSGIGISDENRETIFLAFKKISPRNRHFHEGLGNSLYISKELIELLGGSIWFNSEINKGSTFYVRLPLQETLKDNETLPPEGSSRIVRNEKIPDLRGRKILIADDIESNRDYLMEVLKETHATIIVAKNGVECVNICRSEMDIDCILMDILMPEVDGVEACRQIRKFNKNIRIIAQTAYALREDIQEAINADYFNDYLVKPVRMSDLYQKLGRLLN